MAIKCPLFIGKARYLRKNHSISTFLIVSARGAVLCLIFLCGILIRVIMAQLNEEATKFLQELEMDMMADMFRKYVLV